MIEWFMADTTAPNWVLMLFAACAGLGLWALADATSRLKEATEKWNETGEMYEEIIALLGATEQKE